MTNKFQPWVLDYLRCPYSGDVLSVSEEGLRSRTLRQVYPIDEEGIALFAEDASSVESRLQQVHYDRVSLSYIENLGYPHTEEYLCYLDHTFRQLINGRCKGDVLELCCGSGEAGNLLAGEYERLIGIDISYSMVKEARRKFPSPNASFHQGDAIEIPLLDSVVDAVIIFGGIHHIPNREKLFSEVSRVLRPNGALFFREPCDDFAIWRWIRLVIYYFSSALDHKTESPLRREATLSQLSEAGFMEAEWKTCGFIGFCVFMNSDVLWFNSFFRYVPYIRKITRGFIKIDRFLETVPFLKYAGTIAIASAVKKGANNLIDE